MFFTVSVLIPSQLKLPSLIFTHQFEFIGSALQRSLAGKTIYCVTDSSVHENTRVSSLATLPETFDTQSQQVRYFSGPHRKRSNCCQHITGHALFVIIPGPGFISTKCLNCIHITGKVRIVVTTGPTLSEQRWKCFRIVDT